MNIEEDFEEPNKKEQMMLNILLVMSAISVVGLFSYVVYNLFY